MFQDQTHSTLTLKLDIGVHTEYRIKQDNLVFDFITSDEGIKLLVNPIEQMIVEKTSSFIRFNAFSTRMKDIFDIYYLISNYPFQKHKIINIINFMFIETGQVQSLDEYQEFMINLLNNDMFKSNLKRSDNWTGIDVKDILKGLSQFLTKLTNKISF